MQPCSCQRVYALCVNNRALRMFCKTHLFLMSLKTKLKEDIWTFINLFFVFYTDDQPCLFRSFPVNGCSDFTVLLEFIMQAVFGLTSGNKYEFLH